VQTRYIGLSALDTLLGHLTWGLDAKRATNIGIVLCIRGLRPRFSLEKQVFEGSREDFLISGGEVWEEESAIVGSLVFEDAIDGMEHLSSDSDQSLELCFVAAQQGLVEGPEMRIMA